jgi:hypothetical protein
MYKEVLVRTREKIEKVGLPVTTEHCNNNQCLGCGILSPRLILNKRSVGVRSIELRANGAHRDFNEARLNLSSISILVKPCRQFGTIPTPACRRLPFLSLGSARLCYGIMRQSSRRGIPRTCPAEIVGVAGLLIGIPFASRFRSCVSRVAGA